jgi:hypothetical protein
VRVAADAFVVDEARFGLSDIVIAFLPGYLLDLRKRVEAISRYSLSS